MIGISPGTTNDKYISYNSSFLERDNSLEPSPERGKLGFIHGTSQADSSKEDIQNRELLGLIDAASQPEGITGARQFPFMEGRVTSMVSPHQASMEAGPDLSRVAMVFWTDGRAFLPSFREAESLTTDSEQEYAALNFILYSHIRRRLEPSAVINQWGVSGALQPLSAGLEFPNVTADLEPTDKRANLSEISQRLADVAQREDDWDGLESLKPNEISLNRARYIMEKLLNSVFFEGKGELWVAPYICSDEDGYITVEWYGEERQLHLHIEEEEVEYITLEKTDTKRKTGGDTLPSDDCFELWKWLINE